MKVVKSGGRPRLKISIMISYECTILLHFIACSLSKVDQLVLFARVEEPRHGGVVSLTELASAIPSPLPPTEPLCSAVSLPFSCILLLPEWDFLRGETYLVLLSVSRPGAQ